MRKMKRPAWKIPKAKIRSSRAFFRYDPPPAPRKMTETEIAQNIQDRMTAALQGAADVMTEADRLGFVVSFGGIELHSDGGGRRFVAPLVTISRLILGRR